jgi:hypothetical protein
MKSFFVVVKTSEAITLFYSAIGAHSFDVWDQAIERFGICKVSVRPA